jgi:aspirochlorine biosynthesis cytochrome P450 monooxygenase
MKTNASLSLLAGTETTAKVLSGLMYHLFITLDAYAKFVIETRSTFAASSEMTTDTLARTPYLDAALSEDRRIYFPGGGSGGRVVPP